MKVKLCVCRVTSLASQAPGDEIEVPDAEGLAMIEEGQATLVDEEPPEDPPPPEDKKPEEKKAKK